MSLSRIVMRLARNPGTEFAGGDDHRGYALTAPLTEDGHLDAVAYAKAKGRDGSDHDIFEDMKILVRHNVGG